MGDKLDEDQKLYDCAGIIFKKLGTHEGDIVIVTVPINASTDQIESFESTIQEGVTVFCTRDNVTIDVLPKAELNALGWYNFNASSKDMLN